ncbi:MAG: ABC transporter substrate-binding protein [Hyphomicrobiales bacterium]|nr:MAG: ABC transporter substrate-binding protein [Hyphomicrobiales bacterium]
MKRFLAATTILATLCAPAIAEIKIGATLAITGPASFLGDPEAKSLKMVVDQVNKAGGINGEMIKLIIYDDGANPNKARTFAIRLIEEDEVVAVVGASTSGTTMALIPLFEEAEIPFVSLGGAIAIIDPVKSYVFKTPHTDRMACSKIFEDIAARGMKKVGMISGTGGFGASMRKQCLEIATATGIEVVADETYGPKDADMTPQLTNIRNAEGIQAIINPGFGQGPAVVTRNYAQLGIELPFYQSHGVASNSYIELAGKASEGVRLPATALLIPDLMAADDPQKEVVLNYISSYTEMTGEPVSTFGGYAYDGLRLVLEAIRAKGSSKPKDIRDGLEEIQGFAGVTGVFNFSATDHLGLDLSAFRMLEIRDGGWTPAK